MRSPRTIAVLTALSALTALAMAAPARAVVDPAVPTGVIAGLANPETIVWDAPTNAWYISELGFTVGGGRISKLPAGETTPTVFATGLSSPMGVVIHDGTMYVAAGPAVVLIDMDDPTQRTSISMGSAGSAGDLDVDPATGDIYVGSLGGNIILKIHDGVPAPLATIGSPDGVYWADGAVYVNTLQASPDSGLFRIDPDSGAISTVATVPFGLLDGLERDGDSWLMTDFGKGQFWRVNPDASLTLLAQLAPGSAQLGFDPATRTAAVPNLAAGVIAFFTI